MKTVFSVVMAISLAALSTQAISADTPVKPAKTVSLQALTPGNGIQSVTTPSMVDNHGFEASEGFAPGYLDGQSGWTVFASSTAQPVVDNSDPATGAQHMQIAQDANIGTGTNVGGFSPDLGPQTAGVESRVSVDVKVTATGGADYFVAAQAPSLGFLTWQVNFEWLGGFYVLDDTGGGLAFEDTGFVYPVNTYFNLEVVTNPGGSPGIDYYIDGSLVYSQVLMLSADTVEQVVIYGDNWNFGEVANFDNLMIDTDSAVVPAGPAMPVPSLGTFGLILLSLGLLFTVRRKLVL